ncbi:DNA polymerase III subunit delta' [Heyndrickxia acidicola]|uniref:DNA polymerase III subunit delta' n=1 Tax=Heyndrickxia acidicola TaxID=209389 RepID=A0ABU6MNR6_9BACI|nr:DNA polymerase III subunit delta' [Heyndrickxia acidicola]MED1206028.1 DNA polymerase III subunit delta' [Heyndrickxia acidicola]
MELTVTWDELKNVQPLAAKVLKNGILKKRLAHAYLFEGERGTGKQEAGVLLAKSLFCLEPQDSINPCGGCTNCRRIENGNHPDVHFVEPDGLSIKKEQIRNLQQEFAKSGVESKKKLYMVVHADKMTINAANSLLKFLEEPNSETIAILITEQIQRILPTILSRCQVVSFKPFPSHYLKTKLLESGVNPNISLLLSTITNNKQEAILLNNDEWFAQARILVLKLYEALKKDSLYAMVSLQEDWISHFSEKQQLDLGLDLLLYIYKDLLSHQIGDEEQLLYPDRQSEFEADSLQLSPRSLSEKMTAILEAKRKLNANMNPQLLMEQLVLKLQEGSTVV